MLSWAVTFLIIAIIAGLLGFIGIAGAAAELPKFCFWSFSSSLWSFARAWLPTKDLTLWSYYMEDVYELL